MISNQIIQDTIDGIKKISKVDLYVTDKDGNVLAATKKMDDKFSDAVLSFAKNKKKTTDNDDYCIFKVADESNEELIVISDGKDAKIFGEMAAFQLKSMSEISKDFSEADMFVKNLLFDNLLIADVYNKTKQLNISVKGKRCVFIIEVEKKNAMVIEAIKDLFIDHKTDLITDVDDNYIILIKELEDTKDYSEVESIANTIVDMLNTEAMIKARVAYGTIVKDIKDVSKSYKEAKTALDVGAIFFGEESIIAYNNLGIGRLIYQMPMKLCKQFVDEVIGEEGMRELDEETLVTVNKFFENNLNVSETSRQLYIHRNTLVYRLDKIQKNTGLDLRVFDDAITFKIAMMIVKYMDYMENIDN